MDDYIRRMLEQQEQMRRLTDPLGSLRERFLEPSVTDRVIRGDDYQRRLIEEATRLPTIDVVSTGITKLVDDHIKLQQQNSNALVGGSIASAVAAFDYKSAFRLPEVTEFSRLAQIGQVAPSIHGIVEPLSNLETAMRSMHTPWLNRDNIIGSAQSFAEIQAIGRAVNAGMPYDDQVSATLRGALGDWRNIATLPDLIYNDVTARSKFYIDLGFNPALTEFTAEAFDETTALAGLGPDDSVEVTDDDEEGLRRTNRAHDLFQRFERKVRRHIDAQMTAACGPDWIKTRTPPGMLAEWKKKKAEAAAKGDAEEPLIAYAEFPDYKMIIERNDNWTQVFKPIFGRREDVQESFIRLFPIRNDTMHSRIILLDDELLLQVETRRIIRAIEQDT